MSSAIPRIKRRPPSRQTGFINDEMQMLTTITEPDRFIYDAITGHHNRTRLDHLRCDTGHDNRTRLDSSTMRYWSRQQTQTGFIYDAILVTTTEPDWIHSRCDTSHGIQNQ
ncbi:hypothetical protein Btru_060109 [Bulinus truncatus]|nr:hypothetical protein Btru_060109 [Bulinus truncatus]